MAIVDDTQLYSSAESDYAIIEHADVGGGGRGYSHSMIATHSE